MYLDAIRRKEMQTLMKTSSINETSQTIGESASEPLLSTTPHQSENGTIKTADIVPKETNVCRRRYGESALSLVTKNTRMRKAYVLVFQEMAQSRARGMKNCK